MLNSAKGYVDFYKGKTFEKLTFVIGNDFFNSGSDGILLVELDKITILDHLKCLKRD